MDSCYENEQEGPGSGPDHLCGPKSLHGPMNSYNLQVSSLFYIVSKKLQTSFGKKHHTRLFNFVLKVVDEIRAFVTQPI